MGWKRLSFDEITSLRCRHWAGCIERTGAGGASSTMRYSLISSTLTGLDGTRISWPIFRYDISGDVWSNELSIMDEAGDGRVLALFAMISHLADLIEERLVSVGSCAWGHQMQLTRTGVRYRKQGASDWCDFAMSGESRSPVWMHEGRDFCLVESSTGAVIHREPLVKANILPGLLVLMRRAGRVSSGEESSGQRRYVEKSLGLWQSMETAEPTPMQNMLLNLGLDPEILFC